MRTTNPNVNPNLRQTYIAPDSSYRIISPFEMICQSALNTSLGHDSFESEDNYAW